VTERHSGVLVRRRSLPAFVSAGLLAGCPQLAEDDFGKVRLAAPPAPPTSGGEADAGADAAGPDVAAAGMAALRAALAHRYGFEGTGINPVDSVSGALAYIYNGSLYGQGFVRLTGGEEFVSLPNGLLSATADRSIEAWLVWRGGAPWQRIFDFGVSSAGKFTQGLGASYLFLAASSDSGGMMLAFTANGYENEVQLSGSVPLPTDVLTHVVVVVDSARDLLALYLDGALHGSTPLTQPLASIQDVNVWLGHSQYAGDPNLDADITEFRIYAAALDAKQVALSHALGPDAPLTAPPSSVP